MLIAICIRIGCKSVLRGAMFSQAHTNDWVNKAVFSQINSLSPRRFRSNIELIVMKLILKCVYWALPLKCQKTSLMIGQHWFRRWLNATGHLAITWADVDTGCVFIKWCFLDQSLLDPIFYFLKPDKGHIWSCMLIPMGSTLDHLQRWAKPWSHNDQGLHWLYYRQSYT